MVQVKRDLLSVSYEPSTVFVFVTQRHKSHEWDLAQGLSDFLTLSTVSCLKKCFLVWVDVLRVKVGIGHSAVCNKMPQLEQELLSAVLCFGRAAVLERTSGWALL